MPKAERLENRCELIRRNWNFCSYLSVYLLYFTKGLTEGEHFKRLKCRIAYCSWILYEDSLLCFTYIILNLVCINYRESLEYSTDSFKIIMSTGYYPAWFKISLNNFIFPWRAAHSINPAFAWPSVDSK